jgi:hypothetical protein
LVNVLHGGTTELDMLVWLSRVSLELIGQAGIGVSFDTLSETPPPNEYMLAAKQLMYVSLIVPFVVTAQNNTDTVSESDHFRFLSKDS